MARIFNDDGDLQSAQWNAVKLRVNAALDRVAAQLNEMEQLARTREPSAELQVRRILPAVQWTQGPQHVYLNVKFAHKIDAPAAGGCEVQRVSIARQRLLVETVAQQRPRPRDSVAAIQYFLDFTLGGEIDVNASTWKREASGKGLSLKLRKLRADAEWKSIAAASGSEDNSGSADDDSDDDEEEGEEQQRDEEQGGDEEAAPREGSDAGKHEEHRPRRVHTWYAMEAKLAKRRDSSNEAVENGHHHQRKTKKEDEQPQQQLPKGQTTTQAKAQQPPGGRRMQGEAGGRQPRGTEQGSHASSSIWEVDGLKQQFEDLMAEHDLRTTGSGKMRVADLVAGLREWIPFWGSVNEGDAPDAAATEDDATDGGGGGGGSGGGSTDGESQLSARERAKARRQRFGADRGAWAGSTAGWAAALLVFAAALAFAWRGRR
jgi:hypothetical protein